MDQTKTCRRCQEPKPLDEFRKNRRICWKCECAQENARHHRKQASDPKYRAKRVQNAQKWESVNPEKVRDRNLKRLNITGAEVDAKLAEQGGVCAICGTVGRRERQLDVDHDHKCCDGNFSCGECLRGLLCNDCNMGIGKFRDDPQLLLAAAGYILKWRGRDNPAEV